MKPGEAKRLARLIIAVANQCDITLRTFGGAGVMLLYGTHPRNDLFRRETDDIDLIGRYEQQYLWEGLFTIFNFKLHTSGGQAQYEFRGIFEGREEQVHVYCDPMRFSEDIPGPYYCPEWPETVPPTALLLSKLIIQREYDWHEQFQDVSAVLFAIGGQEPAHQLDERYLARSLFRGFSGWRRWLLVNRALLRVEERLRCAGGGPVENQARSGLVNLREVLARGRRDWRWKLARMLHDSGVPLVPVYPVDAVEPLSEL